MYLASAFFAECGSYVGESVEESACLRMESRENSV